MTEVVLILTVGLVLLSISQVLTVRVFLKHLEIVPKKEEVSNSLEDANDFQAEKYIDISDVTAEQGIKSLTQK